LICNGKRCVEITGNKGWRMIASPRATTYSDFLDGFVTQGFTGSTYPLKQPNFMWFDETDTLTTNMSWRRINSLADNTTPGRGYYFYVFGDVADDADYNLPLPRVMSVEGTPNFTSGTFNYSNSNHPITFTPRVGGQAAGSNYYETNLADQGWNMLGNPALRALDWDHQTGWTKTNIDNSIYAWDPQSAEWKFWNGTTGNLSGGLIPPFQAFWVRATGLSPQLSFTDAVLTDGGFFLGGASQAKSNGAKIYSKTINLLLSNSNLSSNMFISFTNDAKIGPDRFDAYRLDPLNDDWVEFFSLSSPEHTLPLSINNLPIDGPDSYTIPVFVGGQKDGKALNGIYEISWELPNNWPADWSITLHDHKQRKAVSMKQNNHYFFSQNSSKSQPVMMSSQDNPMFKLPDNIFTPISAMSVAKSSNQLAPFTIIIKKGDFEDDTEYIGLTPELKPNFPNPFRGLTNIQFSLPEADRVKLEVYDMFGKLIETIANYDFSAGVHHLQWNSNRNVAGIYLLRMTTSNYTQTIKLNVF